jgi:hypothetical protein
MNKLNDTEKKILENTLIRLQKIISAKFFWEALATSINQNPLDSSGKYRDIHELLFSMENDSTLRSLIAWYNPQSTFKMINLSGLSTDAYNEEVIRLLNKILHGNKKEISAYRKYLNIIKNDMSVGIAPIIQYDDWLTKENIFQKKYNENNDQHWWNKLKHNNPTIINQPILSMVNSIPYNDTTHNSGFSLQVLIDTFKDIITAILYTIKGQKNQKNKTNVTPITSQVKKIEINSPQKTIDTKPSRQDTYAKNNRLSSKPPYDDEETDVE